MMRMMWSMNNCSVCKSPIMMAPNMNWKSIWYHEVPRLAPRLIIGLRLVFVTWPVHALRDFTLCFQGAQNLSSSTPQAYCAYQLIRSSAELRRITWADEVKKARYNWIDLHSILTTPAYLKKAAEFIPKTGLLGQFKGLKWGHTTW